MAGEVNVMKIKKYEAKDEDELRLMKDPDKLKGWEGSIEAHLRSVRYSERKAKGNGWAGSK